MIPSIHTKDADFKRFLNGHRVVAAPQNAYSKHSSEGMRKTDFLNNLAQVSSLAEMEIFSFEQIIADIHVSTFLKMYFTSTHKPGILVKKKLFGIPKIMRGELIIIK